MMTTIRTGSSPVEPAGGKSAGLAFLSSGRGYREFEQAAFTLVRAAMREPGPVLAECRTALQACAPEDRNRAGYLLALAGVEAWQPEAGAAAVPLWKNDPVRPGTPCLDALALRWRLLRGADLGRLRQFLQTGAC